MKEFPLVSVGIITYNQKEYLKECIKSVLNQDYPNIEIVIGDDGSTDGTQEILKEYKEQYPNKFKLILHETNKGITNNSNSVLKKCTGKYIAWLGGDDLMLPGKIKKQVKYMESHPKCSICYHNLEVFDSNTGKLLFYFNDKIHYEGDIRVSIKYGTFNGASSSMIRNRDAPRHGFDERLPIASDWLYWIDILANGGTINYIPEVLGKYRRHNKNITQNTGKLEDNIVDHLNTINILLKKYPQYKNEIFFRASRIWRGLRFKVDYKVALKFSLMYKFNIESFMDLLLYFVTFKKVRL